MRRTAVAIGLVAVLALAGCAGTRGASVEVTDPEPAPTTGATTSTTSTTATTAPAPDAASLRCGDVDVATPPIVLTADAAVTAITLCEFRSIYVPGSGDWSSWDAHVVPADRVPTLVAALAQPTAAPDAERICTANGVAVPIVAVALADGTAGLVQVPSDGCHPQENVRALLYDIVDATPAAPEPLALRTDDTALRTGCLGAKSIVPSQGPATAVEVPDSSLSACDYVTATNQDTTLRAANPVDAAAMRALLAALSPTPPAGCATPATEIGDFVSVVSAPPVTPADQRPPNSASGGVPLFSVATTGCPVVVDGAWTILGWADPGDVATLVAATS